IGVDDMVIPSTKGSIVDGARKAVLEVERQRLDGAITHGERHNKIIDIWHRATENVSEELISEMRRADLARAQSNTICTIADSGYRTRRLVDVAQDVIVTEEDCQTFDGITVNPIMEGGDILEPLRDRVVGRVAQEDVYDPLTGDQLVGQNDEVSEELANAIQEAGIEQVKIRSVLTCETRRGVCRRCYGRKLASGRMEEIGEAAGVIAADSIGAPGTPIPRATFPT